MPSPPIYADSSVVVSLYLTDAHQAKVAHRVRGVSSLWLTPLHLAEWEHAIAQHLHRREISEQEALAFLAAFERDRGGALWAWTRFPENSFERIAPLARKWVKQVGGKTLDTLHVACALELGARQFWTLDQRQAKLAKAAGLSLY